MRERTSPGTSRVQTDRQRRGQDCTVCGVVLAPGTAIDLGPRLVDGRMRFPRACRHHEEASTR